MENKKIVVNVDKKICIFLTRNWKDFLKYWKIQKKNLQVKTLERGSFPCHFLKLKKSALILEKSTLMVVIFLLNFSFKYCLKIFFLRGISFKCSRWNVYRNAIFPRNLLCLGKFLVASLLWRMPKTTSSH